MSETMVKGEFGAQSMVAPLARVIMRKPGRSMAAADPVLWHYAGRLDGATLEQQHKALTAIVAQTGAEVIWLDEPLDELSDAVFTHDPSLVTNGGAILLAMGKPLRRGETAAHGRLYQTLGVPILGRVEAPGTVEGGDCLWLDERTLIVGRGFRTNQSGIEQLGALLAPLGVTLLAFDLPVSQGEAACLHLMSLISPLDHDLALVHAPLLPVAFYRLLRDRGVTLVEAPAAEYHASNTLSINVLALAPRHGVMLDGLPETAAALRDAGCRIETFPGDELCMKAEGGPTCLTRPVLRVA